MKKKKILVGLIAVFISLILTGNCCIAETITLGEKQLIELLFESKTKPIEFSDSKEYNNERHIVRKITNIAESEKHSEGVMKKAAIRIAVVDLNNDGIKEILAYIVQSEWCSGNGKDCTFLVLQQNGTGKWKKLFETLTNEDIGILAIKKDGYHDFFFKDSLVDSQKKEELLWIWRWDGKQYNPYAKKQAIYNFTAQVEKMVPQQNSWVPSGPISELFDSEVP